MNDELKKVILISVINAIVIYGINKMFLSKPKPIENETTEKK